MAEDVEKPGEAGQPAPDPKPEEAQHELTEEELQQEVDVFQREENRRGYEQRKARKPKDEEPEPAGQPAPAAVDTDAVAHKVADILAPRLEGSLITQKIDAMTPNPAMRKLIKFHFENTVTASAGDLDARLEAAWAIANRKALKKQSQETIIAAQRRAQMGQDGQGTHQGGPVPQGDKLLSPEQLADLKKRGWPDAKIERFKANLLKNSGRM